VPQHTSHLTTEQLSAFLDQQLSAQEQSTCQAHLNTCQHCQQQQTELEQTVLLVHSLPQVPLPRSFVLPIASTTQSRVLPIKGNIAPKIARQAHNRVLIFPIARTTMRTTSALVAVLGLFFTLSGLLTIIFPNTANFLVPAPSSKIVQVRNPLPTPLPHKIFVGAEPPLMGAKPPLNTQSKGEATPSPNKVQKQTPSHVPDTYQQFFNPSTPEGHLSIGLLLLILGAVSTIYFTKLEKTISTK
jgi:hypothetical protein